MLQNLTHISKHNLSLADGKYGLDIFEGRITNTSKILMYKLHKNINQQFIYEKNKLLCSFSDPSLAVGIVNGEVALVESSKAPRVDMVFVSEFKFAILLCDVKLFIGLSRTNPGGNDFFHLEPVSESENSLLFELSVAENGAQIFIIDFVRENPNYICVSPPRAETFLGHVFYLNLDHRIDRRVQISEQLSFISPVERISAFFERDRGWIGCAKSHIFALQESLKRGYSRVTIVEDDFQWRDKDMDSSRLASAVADIARLDVKWDFFLLAGYMMIGEKIEGTKLFRAKSAQTTCGYVVNGRENMEKLLQNFLESLSLMNEHVKTMRDYFHGLGTKYAIDQHWKKLQTESIWLTTLPETLAGQRRSYSDIERRPRIETAVDIL